MTRVALERRVAALEKRASADGWFTTPQQQAEYLQRRLAELHAVGLLDDLQVAVNTGPEALVAYIAEQQAIIDQDDQPPLAVVKMLLAEGALTLVRQDAENVRKQPH